MGSPVCLHYRGGCLVEKLNKIPTFQMGFQNEIRCSSGVVGAHQMVPKNWKKKIKNNSWGGFSPVSPMFLANQKKNGGVPPPTPMKKIRRGFFPPHGSSPPVWGVFFFPQKNVFSICASIRWGFIFRGPFKSRGDVPRGAYKIQKNPFKWLMIRGGGFPGFPPAHPVGLWGAQKKNSH